MSIEAIESQYLVHRHAVQIGVNIRLTKDVRRDVWIDYYAGDSGSFVIVAQGAETPDMYFQPQWPGGWKSDEAMVFEDIMGARKTFTDWYKGDVTRALT